MFLRVTLNDGRSYVSEFSKLGRVQRYVTQVMAGQKPFNVWSIVGRTHPVSGEPFLTRSRLMLNGSDILAVEQVERKASADPDSMNPLDFRPVVQHEKMRGGLYKTPSEGIVHDDYTLPGDTEFPIHRDDATLRRFVYAVYSETAPVRHWLDPEAPVYAGSVGEDEDEDEHNMFEDEDEDEDER
jgi:hypothetical protein